MCQRPKRAFIISTRMKSKVTRLFISMCQRPKRAFIISTVYNSITYWKITCSFRSVNALNGLLSFLQNTGTLSCENTDVSTP